MLTSASDCPFFIHQTFDESQQEKISTYDGVIGGRSEWTNDGETRKMRVTFNSLLYDISSLDSEELSQVIKRLIEEKGKRRAERASGFWIGYISKRFPCLRIELTVFDEMQNVGNMLTRLPSEEEEEHRLLINKCLDKARSYLEQYFESLELNGKVKALVPNSSALSFTDCVYKTLKFKKEEQIKGKNVSGFALLKMKCAPGSGRTRKSIVIDTFIPNYMKNVELTYKDIPLSFVKAEGRECLQFGLMTSVLLTENRFDLASENFKHEDLFKFFDEFFDWLLDKIKKI